MIEKIVSIMEILFEIPMNDEMMIMVQRFQMLRRLQGENDEFDDEDNFKDDDDGDEIKESHDSNEEDCKYLC